MKNSLIIQYLFVLLTGCVFGNYESETITSPSKQFLIKATVNRTDKKSTDYADVIIHIYDKNKKKIAEINSKAGDANKWALGWTIAGDTIVLQSSDIGNKAWTIVDNNWIEIKMTDYLDFRAQELKKKKYK